MQASESDGDELLAAASQEAPAEEEPQFLRRSGERYQLWEDDGPPPDTARHGDLWDKDGVLWIFVDGHFVRPKISGRIPKKITRLIENPVQFYRRVELGLSLDKAVHPVQRAAQDANEALLSCGASGRTRGSWPS